MSEYKEFLTELRKKLPKKTKAGYTKSGEALWKEIDNKSGLAAAYIAHQKEKQQYAQRITAFMMDYNPIENFNDPFRANITDQTQKSGRYTY